MNGHLFNRTQFNFFAKHLRADLGYVNCTKTKSCQWIVDVHRLGKIVNGKWLYTEKDRVAIIDLIKSQLNVDLLISAYPDKTSREALAASNNNEKLNALAVSEDFILVNSLSSLQINKHSVDMTVLASLGIYINAKKVESVEHKQIVLVENLAVMANLAKLVLLDNAKHLENALWVYRGDLKREQSTGRAYDFFRRFKATHQLICFADFDPEGFRIAITSGATTILSPVADTVVNFNAAGPDTDYFKQTTAKQYINNQTDLSLQIEKLFAVMSEHRQTIKQEHILSHQIPLSVFEIN